jgi:hypothetical protein
VKNPSSNQFHFKIGVRYDPNSYESTGKSYLSTSTSWTNQETSNQFLAVVRSPESKTLATPSGEGGMTLMRVETRAALEKYLALQESVCGSLFNSLGGDRRK